MFGNDHRLNLCKNMCSIVLDKRHYDKNFIYVRMYEWTVTVHKAVTSTALICFTFTVAPNLPMLRTYVRTYVHARTMLFILATGYLTQTTPVCTHLRMHVGQFIPPLSLQILRYVHTYICTHTLCPHPFEPSCSSRWWPSSDTWNVACSAGGIRTRNTYVYTYVHAHTYNTYMCGGTVWVHLSHRVRLSSPMNTHTHTTHHTHTHTCTLPHMLAHTTHAHGHVNSIEAAHHSLVQDIHD